MRPASGPRYVGDIKRVMRRGRTTPDESNAHFPLKVSSRKHQHICKLDQCTNDHLWSRSKCVKQTARTVYPSGLHACGFGTNYVKWIRGDEPDRSNGVAKPICDVLVHFWRWFVHFYLVNTHKSLEICI